MSPKKKRPDVLSGKTVRKITGCGQLYTTLNYQDDDLQEVIIILGKSGGCGKAVTEGIGKLISYALELGGEIDEIVHRIKGISCHQQEDKKPSCLTAVAITLEENNKQSVQRGQEAAC